MLFSRKCLPDQSKGVALGMCEIHKSTTFASESTNPFVMKAKSKSTKPQNETDLI